MRGRAGVRVGVVGVVVLVAAGCTSREMEPVGLATSSVSPSVSVTPSATPSPSEVGAVDLSDPELGIVFEDVPVLSGDEADVYNVIATYEVEYWRSLSTNQVSPGSVVVASPEMQAKLAQMVQSNIDDRWVFSGVLNVRISDVAVTGDSATGTTCRDFSGVSVTEDVQPISPDEAGTADIMLTAPTLSRGTGVGQWVIESNRVSGTC